MAIIPHSGTSPEESKGQGEDIKGLDCNGSGSLFLIREDCGCDPIGIFMKTGELVRDCLDEVTEDIALGNPSKAILYDFPADQVKSFFIRSYQILNSLPAERINH